MYVDDLTQSISPREDVHKIVISVPATLQTVGFDHTKFSINDIAKIPIEPHAKEVHNFSSESFGKTLGVRWNIQQDIFFFDIRETFLSKITLRSLLSFVSSIFYPLGLIPPWILPAKLLFQDAMHLKLDWDDAVPSNM